ncbi:MAG: DUF2796 domain-containing protein [Pseudomonadota bacterium]
MPIRALYPVLVLILIPSIIGLAAAETRSLQAHIHGRLTLLIALDGPALEIALEAPGADIVGFEHEAKTAAQKAAVAAALDELSDPMTLFLLPDNAGCVGQSADVELRQEGTHSTFEAVYSFGCTDPLALTEVETRLFDLYPSVQQIDVEYVTPAGQGAADLVPGSALRLPSS